MKSYRDDTGRFHRTQADAKASGRPFEPIDIPTSHQELIDFVNNLIKVTEPAPEAISHTCDVCHGDGPADGGICGGCGTGYSTPPPYKNGDPTVPVMKSRDPMARFTCRTCGTVNAPEPDR